jgi:phospholipid/cholesterol/gamma-HCH transport system ATP-binding protein
MRRDRPPVLDCYAAEVPLPAQDIERVQAMRIALTVEPGELVLVDVRDPDHERVLADAVCGLVAPTGGAIRFLGRDWRDQTAEYANALRGRIGHLFRAGGWLPYLSVVDNIVLQQLHHTRRAYAVLRDEAARLATRFGLPGLPTGRAAEMREADLVRAACVRAFLGTPSLVVVEDVVAEDHDLLPPLVEAMREARDRDAAILWLVQEPRLFRDPTLPATQRVQLRGSALVATEVA